MDSSNDKRKSDLSCDRRPSIFEILANRGQSIASSPMNKAGENDGLTKSPSKENVSNNFFSRLKSFTSISKAEGSNDSGARKSLFSCTKPVANMQTLVLPIIVGSGDDNDDDEKLPSGSQKVVENGSKAPSNTVDKGKETHSSKDKNSDKKSSKDKQNKSYFQSVFPVSSKKEKRDEHKHSSQKDKHSDHKRSSSKDDKHSDHKHSNHSEHKHSSPKDKHSDHKRSSSKDKHGDHKRSSSKDKHSDHKRSSPKDNHKHLSSKDKHSDHKHSSPNAKHSDHKHSSPKDNHKHSSSKDKHSDHKRSSPNDKHSDHKHSSPKDNHKHLSSKDKHSSSKDKHNDHKHSSPKEKLNDSKHKHSSPVRNKIIIKDKNSSPARTNSKDSNIFSDSDNFPRTLEVKNKSGQFNKSNEIKPSKIQKKAGTVSLSKKLSVRLTQEAVLEHSKNTSLDVQDNGVVSKIVEAGKRSVRSISSDTTDSEYQTVIRLESDDEDSEPVHIPVESDSESECSEKTMPKEDPKPIKTDNTKSVKMDMDSSMKKDEKEFSIKSPHGNTFVIKKNTSASKNIVKVTKVARETNGFFSIFNKQKTLPKPESKTISITNDYPDPRYNVVSLVGNAAAKSPQKIAKQSPKKTPQKSPIQTVNEQENKESPKQGLSTPTREIIIPPKKSPKPPTPAALRKLKIDSISLVPLTSDTDTVKSDSDGSNIARRGARVRKLKNFGDDIVLIGHKNLSFYNLLHGVSDTGSDSEPVKQKSSINRKIIEAKKLEAVKSPKKVVQQKALQLKKKAEQISRTKTMNEKLPNEGIKVPISIKKKVSPKKVVRVTVAVKKSVKRQRKQSLSYISDPDEIFSESELAESDLSLGSESENDSLECVTPKRKRGRPRKSYENDDEYQPVAVKSKTIKSYASDDSEDDEFSGSERKMKRGRPRKSYENDDEYKPVAVKTKTKKSYASDDSEDGEFSGSERKAKRRQSSCEQKVKSKKRKSGGLIDTLEDEPKPVQKKLKPSHVINASYESTPIHEGPKRALTGRPEIHEIFSDELGVGKRARRQTEFFNVGNMLSESKEKMEIVDNSTAASVASENMTDSEESTSDERFEMDQDFVNPLNVPFSPEIRAYALNEDPFQNRFFLTPDVNDWNDVAQEMPYFECSYPLILPEFPYILEDCGKCKINRDFTCKMTFIPDRGVIKCKMDDIVETSNSLNGLVSIPLYRENQVLLNGNRKSSAGHSPSRRSSRLRKRVSHDDDVVMDNVTKSEFPDKSPVLEKFFPNLDFSVLRGVVDRLKAGATSVNNSDCKTPVKVASCSSSTRDNRSPMMDHSYAISLPGTREGTPDLGS